MNHIATMGLYSSSYWCVVYGLRIMRVLIMMEREICTCGIDFTGLCVKLMEWGVEVHACGMLFQLVHLMRVIMISC